MPLHAAWQRRRAYRALREHVKSLPHDAAMALVDELVNALAAPPARGAVLSWPALRRLAGGGVALGALAHAPAALPGSGSERVADEIAGAVEDLRRETGRGPSAFAYPGGDVPPARADRLLRAAGIRLAFTTSAGASAPDAPDWLGAPAASTSDGGPAPSRCAPGSPRSDPPGRGAAQRVPDAGPPRVAYVMSRFPKLTETFILGELVALERRGVPVELYPLLRERAALVHPEAARVAARALPAVRVAADPASQSLAAPAPGAYLRRLGRRARGTWGSPNFFVGAIGIFPKVAHAARRMQADGVTHVHCHFANHPAVAGLIIHRLTGIPYSFTAHGSDLHIDRRMLPRRSPRRRSSRRSRTTTAA